MNGEVLQLWKPSTYRLHGTKESRVRATGHPLEMLHHHFGHAGLSNGHALNQFPHTDLSLKHVLAMMNTKLAGARLSGRRRTLRPSDGDG